MTFNRIPLLLLLARSATATLRNNTIDDQDGDHATGILPDYEPRAGWDRGAACSTCPNPSGALRHTWHAATHLPTDPQPLTVSLSFNGE
jgi:hypothetical protein